jgi:hypothetical protein
MMRPAVVLARVVKMSGDYSRLTPIEERLLNKMVGQSLSEPELCQRILTHDPKLIEEFNLSENVWQVIYTIHATTLQDFCTQLLEVGQRNWHGNNELEKIVS